MMQWFYIGTFLRILGPIPSIPEALSVQRDMRASRTSCSDIWIDNKWQLRVGSSWSELAGSSMPVALKTEKKYFLIRDALSILLVANFHYKEKWMVMCWTF